MNFCLGHSQTLTQRNCVSLLLRPFNFSVTALTIQSHERLVVKQPQILHSFDNYFSGLLRVREKIHLFSSYFVKQIISLIGRERIHFNKKSNHGGVVIRGITNNLSSDSVNDQERLVYLIFILIGFTLYYMFYQGWG